MYQMNSKKLVDNTQYITVTTHQRQCRLKAPATRAVARGAHVPRGAIKDLIN